MLTIDELLAAPTEDTIKQTLYDTLALLGVDTTAWEAGSPLRTLIAITANAMATVSPLAVTITESGFLDKATEGWLTLLASQVYGVTRVGATFAVGQLSIHNTGGGVYSFNPGDFVARNATTGKTYSNTASVSIGANATVLATFSAVEIGSASNATAGQIDTSPIAALTVTNPAAFVALDDESDAALRERCRAVLGALSPNGPARAYEYVATTLALNGNVAVTRVKTPTPPGDGTVAVYIAGAAGGIATGEVGLVQAGIDTWAEPLAITATVSSAIEVPIGPIAATVRVLASAGVSGAAWQTSTAQAFVDFTNALPIGGDDFGSGGSWRIGQAREYVFAVLGGRSAGVLQVSVTSPVDDTPLGSQDVATLLTTDVTVTVVQI